MPQVLKDSVRNSIVESAKKEFMQKGYENTSMRDIAHNCAMTVGNLYRYFKSKEELNKYIIQDVINSLDEMVKQLTDNQFELLNDSFVVKSFKKDLQGLVEKLSDDLANIYFSRPDEFNILILSTHYSDQIAQWFRRLVKFIISNMMSNLNEKEIDTLSRAFSVSIVSGITEIMYQNKLKVNELKNVLIIYINSYMDNLIEKW
ncbi:MAG: TetR/AcrR family transcriptional regulator [Erysipelotrichaceae bacterium]